MQNRIDNLQGTFVIGESGKRYRLSQKIGSGAQGVVYEDDSGYAIEMSRKSDISQIVFDNIDKEKFNIEKFIEVSIQQFELLCELKEKETVPYFQHYYAEEAE